MEQNQSNDPGNVPHPSAEFGNVPHASESFRTVPKASESFGKVRNDSERFGAVPHASERKENHSLTVREAARLFEAAGVARTERSIVNWCQPSRTGIARLDTYFDPNERKYYITPRSVELAIAEEKAKAAKINEPFETFGTIPDASETTRKEKPLLEEDEGRMRELERENVDLKITNRGKDYLIEQIQKERAGFFDQLLSANRKVGELEAKLLQIQSPARSQIEGSQNDDTPGNGSVTNY